MKAPASRKLGARYRWQQSLRIRPNGFALVELLVLATGFPSAKARPLYPYLGKSEVFGCPVDKGFLTAC